MTLLSGDHVFAKHKFLVKYKKCAGVWYTGAKQWEGQLRYSEGCLGEILEWIRSAKISSSETAVPYWVYCCLSLGINLVAGPCCGGLLLHVGCTPGFPSPWMRKGSTAFSSLLSPLWAVWVRRGGLTSASELRHLLLSVNLETRGAVMLKRETSSQHWCSSLQFCTRGQTNLRKFKISDWDHAGVVMV